MTKKNKKEIIKKEAKNKTKAFWSDFKDFAFKGNLIDLAIGVVIGGSFNSLVQSLVNNIIMPPIGKILGNTNFSDLYINLNSEKYPSLTAAEAAEVPVIKYGLFLTNLLDFIIMALTIYIMVKFVIRHKKEDATK